MGNLVAHAARRSHPVMGVPAADKAVAPFLAQPPLQLWHGIGRKSAQRVSIEIYHALRQRKKLAKIAQRIVSIQSLDKIRNARSHFAWPAEREGAIRPT